MIPLIKQHCDDLARLCQQYRVKRLEVFGSALEEKRFDDERSDLDFLVEFLPLQAGEHADAYFGLLEALEHLFGRGVDLVMTQAIKNPYFLEKINQARVSLYAA
jgi:predicted nucleotidyltransferase